MWRWLTGAAGLVVATGLLPAGQALDVLVRLEPVLVFLAAITLVAELSDAAGLFVVAADRAARVAGGSVAGLFLLVAGLVTVTTVVLGLDTAAVLVTPVALTLAVRLQVPPAPFAVLTLWLANTASLLLPVSNLTNLLAADRLARLQVSFTPLLASSAAAAVVVTLLVVGGRYRRQLTGRYVIPAPTPVEDRVLLTVAALTSLTAAPLFALGADVSAVAVGAAVVLLIGFAVRAPHHLRTGLLPWRLLLTTVGAFVLVQTALHLGADDLLTRAAGAGAGVGDLLRLSGTAATASNLVNNLPAYLALEPDASTSATRLAAVLIGTNTGSLVTPWGSLATLLWLDRCRAHGLRIPTRELTGLALLGVPLVLICSVLALTASRA